MVAVRRTAPNSATWSISPSLADRTLATAQLPIDFAVSEIRGHGLRPTVVDRQDAAILSVVSGGIGLTSRAAPLAAETATARASRLGLEGEQAIGITEPKVGIRIPGSNQLRFPDAIDLKGARLIESKNVAYQGYTRQLRDYAAYAQDKGFTFELYVRGASNPLGQTRLSKPLADAVRRGEIVLKPIPGR